MKVLVACEFSGIVREAFRTLGHDAWSCDLLPSDIPGQHYQGSIFDCEHYFGPLSTFDLMIAHPDCTYLCSSGLHWNKRDPARQVKTELALEFVRGLMAFPIERIAIENPVGRIGTAIRKADQYIQPYDYGHDASKRTGLWLKNLPKLIADPELYVEPRIVEYPKGSGKMVKRWSNQTDSGQNRLAPSADRWKERARTYQGWADAMADQWGVLPRTAVPASSNEMYF